MNEVEASTVREVVDNLDSKSPGFRASVCDESGSPRRFINIYLDGEDVRFLKNLATPDTAATGWVTAKINRDANGTLTGGTVTFDVNYTNTGQITFTGLHIHYPGTTGVNAPVIINTGLSGTSTVDCTTGSGNVTRVVTVEASNATGLATLGALIAAPDTAYINIHTTVFPGGVAR